VLVLAIIAIISSHYHVYKFEAEINFILVTNYAVYRTDAAISHKTLKMESILMREIAHSFFFSEM
jgi:hypothetical protein